jgi:DNA polymerase-3 subunit gamma/tau
MPFLLQAIDLANDCDLKYKSSKNQRLLVELTLMKLASLNFEGEKKNFEFLEAGKHTSQFLIPAAYFRDKSKTNGTSPKDVRVKQEHPVELAKEVAVVQEVYASASEAYGHPKVQESLVRNYAYPEGIKPETELIPKKININIPSQRVSELSLSSLKAKKEHQINKIEVILDEDNLPNEPFTETELQEHWKVFADQLEEEGRKIIAASLHSDIPKLTDATTIWIELPNSTMKKEIERDKFDLMEYLKQKLNNHFITLKITVNEETALKYAYTPEEKYEKLREKNPVIDVLKKEFDLDL